MSMTYLREPEMRLTASEGQGNEKADDGKRCALRKEKKKEQGASDRESSKAVISSSTSGKADHSSTNAMGRKPQPGKFDLTRLPPISATVTEPAVVSALPLPSMAITISEAIPLIGPAYRVKAHVHCRRLSKSEMPRCYESKEPLSSTCTQSRCWR